LSWCIILKTLHVKRVLCPTMAGNEIDVYFVAVKALIRDRSKLLITHDIFGDWDIPGGRLRKEDFDAPLEAILERKLGEELGDAFVVRIGGPCVFFRHQRVEHGRDGQVARIFAVGFHVDYAAGVVKLGGHHDNHLWVDMPSFRPADYFTGGWLRGLNEYLARCSDRQEVADSSSLRIDEH
jgi:hypothetical protein